VKDNGSSENYVSQKIIDELKRQGAALSAQDAGWMILEMANVDAEDGIEKRQWVELKLLLSASNDSNGSGPSLRAWVWVQTEQLPNLQSGLAMNLNC